MNFCPFCVIYLFSFTGQSSALPPVLNPADLPSHSGTSTSPDLTEDPGNEVPKGTHNPAGRDATSTETTTITETEGRLGSETATNAVLNTHLLSTSSAAETSQHTNVPVVTTAHTGTASSSGNQDKPACTAYMSSLF